VDLFHVDKLIEEFILNQTSCELQC